MTDRTGIFAGSDPIEIIRKWMAEAEASELNDPNAMALATVDADGLPDVRVLLLKAVEGQNTDASFVFYTNYQSAKARQIDATGQAAFVIHWKSLRRQVRVRGTVTREDGAEADAYYASRPLKSRHGAWASPQSHPIASREELFERLDTVVAEHGDNPPRPPHWGGFRLRPVEIELWADGEARLHDCFRWQREGDGWKTERLAP